MVDEPIIRNNRDGTAAIRGTRLTIYNIMDHHLAGRTASWIADFYKIPVQDAEAAQCYIEAHLGELMPKYRRDLGWAQRGNPPHVKAIFAEAHEKLMRRKAEIECEKAREATNARAAG